MEKGEDALAQAVEQMDRIGAEYLTGEQEKRGDAVSTAAREGTGSFGEREKGEVRPETEGGSLTGERTQNFPLERALAKLERETHAAREKWGTEQHRRQTGWGVMELERSAAAASMPGRSRQPGEAITAEELDRAFRRDGRRYDGGFFLY